MVDKLYRGIFWIKDIERFASVVIKAECNSNGFFVTVPNFELLAKSGKEFNHQTAWKTLSKAETEGKEYNYYPRGRVEINKNKVTIFLNPDINNDIKTLLDDFVKMQEDSVETLKTYL